MCLDKFVKYILILVKKKIDLFTKKKIGGTMLAARLAMEYGLACSTAGGTHHAFPSHGSGFCMLNDQASYMTSFRLGLTYRSVIHNNTCKT